MQCLYPMRSAARPLRRFAPVRALRPDQPERYTKCGLYGGRQERRPKPMSLVSSCSRQGRTNMAKQAKNTVCLWYDRDAEEAVRFYAETFPDSSVGAVHRAPRDLPSRKKGDVLVVEFTVMGIPCVG